MFDVYVRACLHVCAAASMQIRLHLVPVRLWACVYAYLHACLCIYACFGVCRAFAFLGRLLLADVRVGMVQDDGPPSPAAKLIRNSSC